MAGLLRRFRKQRTLQEVTQDGNVLYSPEYLTLCAKSIKDKCKNTAPGEPCIFAKDGYCHDGNCTTHGNSPQFWSERRWSK